MKKKARQEYERLKSSNSSYLEIQNANLKLLGAEDILGYILALKSGKKIALLEDEQPAQIQVIGIGDARVVCMPGEVFVKYALDIRKSSPYAFTMVVELANGALPGYVYTPRALEEGGYEVDTSMLHESMGERMAEKAIALLKGEK